MQGNLCKIIATCNIFKNDALPQVFFCHISRKVPKNFPSFSNFFQSISTSHSVGTIQIHACFFNRYTEWMMQIFDRIASANPADTIDAC